MKELIIPHSAKGSQFGNVFTPDVKRDKQKKIKSSDLIDRGAFDDFENIQKELENAIQIDPKLLNERISQGLKAESHNTPISIPLVPEMDFKGFDAFLKEINISSLVESELTPAFEQMFATIADGGNAFESLGNAVLSTIKKLVAQAAALAVISGILSLISGGTAAGGFSFATKFKELLAGLPGHKDGLWRVPKDNYLARLHKNEMVVPSDAAGMLRSNLTPNFNFPGFASMASQFAFPNVASSPGSMQTPSIQVQAAPQQQLIANISGQDLRLILQRTDGYVNRVS